MITAFAVLALLTILGLASVYSYLLWLTRDEDSVQRRLGNRDAYARHLLRELRRDWVRRLAQKDRQFCRRFNRNHLEGLTRELRREIPPGWLPLLAALWCAVRVKNAVAPSVDDLRAMIGLALLAGPAAHK